MRSGTELSQFLRMFLPTFSSFSQIIYESSNSTVELLLTVCINSVIRICAFDKTFILAAFEDAKEDKMLG